MDHPRTLSFPLVAVVGMCGSGKSTVTRFLAGNNWRVIRFGEITIEHLTSSGMEVNETNERLVRESIRNSYGPDAYAKLSLERIQDALANGPTVIDGLYSWAEYKFLYNNIQGPLTVLAIFTTRKLRYSRLAQRPIRPLTTSDAEERDTAEIENLQKGGPIAMADFLIVNDGDEIELQDRMSLFLRNVNSE